MSLDSSSYSPSYSYSLTGTRRGGVLLSSSALFCFSSPRPNTVIYGRVECISIKIKIAPRTWELDGGPIVVVYSKKEDTITTVSTEKMFRPSQSSNGGGGGGGSKSSSNNSNSRGAYLDGPSSFPTTTLYGKEKPLWKIPSPPC